MALAAGVLTSVNQLDFTLLDLSQGLDRSPVHDLLHDARPVLRSSVR
ncbi:hypothetical protein [Cryobacterium sp. MLB-32]|nr:hypothetical protein [Cryobacterium sp. MLB-32]